MVALIVNFFKSLREKFSKNTNKASNIKKITLDTQETIAQIKKELKPEEIIQFLLPKILSEIKEKALEKDNHNQNKENIFLKEVNASGLLSKNTRDHINEQSLIFSCEEKENNAEFKLNKDDKAYNVKVYGNMKVANEEITCKYDGQRLWKSDDFKRAAKNITINKGTIWSFDLIVELQYKGQEGELKTCQKRCEYNILNHNLNTFKDFNELNVNRLDKVSFIEYKEEVKDTHKFKLPSLQTDESTNNNTVTPNNENQSINQEKCDVTNTKTSTGQENTTKKEIPKTVFQISLVDLASYKPNHTNMGSIVNPGAYTSNINSRLIFNSKSCCFNKKM